MFCYRHINTHKQVTHDIKGNKCVLKLSIYMAVYLNNTLHLTWCTAVYHSILNKGLHEILKIRTDISMYLHRNSGFMYPSLYVVLWEAAAAVPLPANLMWNIYFNPLLHTDRALESSNRTETWHRSWKLGEARLQSHSERQCTVCILSDVNEPLDCLLGFLFIYSTDIHKHVLLTYSL